MSRFLFLSYCPPLVSKAIGGLCASASLLILSYHLSSSISSFCRLNLPTSSSLSIYLILSVLLLSLSLLFSQLTCSLALILMALFMCAFFSTTTQTDNWCPSRCQTGECIDWQQQNFVQILTQHWLSLNAGTKAGPDFVPWVDTHRNFHPRKYDRILP